MSAVEVNLKKSMDEKQALVSEVIEIWQFLTLFAHISDKSFELFSVVTNFVSDVFYSNNKINL